MANIMRNRIIGMSGKAKIAFISFFTLLLTIGLYQGWQMTSHAAAPVGQGTWTSAYSGTALPANANLATLSIPAGSNRLLVVSVATTTSAVGAVTITDNGGTTAPTAGGKIMTLAAGDSASTVTWNHTALYYLKEADIAAMTGSALNLKVVGGTGYNCEVYYRVYTGVDQTTPLNDAQNVNNAAGTTTGSPFSPALNVDIDNLAVEVASVSRTTAGTAVRTLTYATAWSGADYTGTGIIVSGPTNQVSIRSRTVPTVLTADTSLHTVSGNNMYSMTGISMRPAPTTTTLSVTSTPLAPTGTRLDSDTGVLMQRLAVTGSAGVTELNSLTLDDIGTASALASVEIYISSLAPQTTLPADAVLIGNAVSWAGTSTVIPLSTGTATNRTLGGTEPLTKYIYVMYDMAVGQATKTVQSSVTGIGVVSPNIPATGLSLSSNVITLNYGGNLLSSSLNTLGASAAKDSDATVVMQHIRLDSNATFDSALELASVNLQDMGTATHVSAVKIYVSPTEGALPTDLPVSAVLVGQITEWDKTLDPTPTIALNTLYGATSADLTVIAGTPKYLYVVYSMFYADVFAAYSVQSKITDIGVVSPDAGATALSYLSNIMTVTRGTWSKITSCGGCHATASILDNATRDAVTGQFPGSHYTHTNKNGYDCVECHAKPVILNHASGFINFSGKIRGNKYSRSANNMVAVQNGGYTFGTCSNVACHNSGVGGTSNPGETRSVVYTTTPQWGTAGTCFTCHGTSGYGAPGYANHAILGGYSKSNSHSGTTHAAQLCTRCHTSITGTGPYTLAAGHADGLYSLPAAGTVGYTYASTGGTCSSTGTGCHGSSVLKWGAVLSCLDCHNSVITRTMGRPGKTLAAVTTEFGLAWGHKKTGRTAVTAADCIVCHLEGEYATQAKSATYHANGNIDLRDPDGVGEVPIKNISGGAFTFQRFSTSFAATSRTSTGQTVNSINNVITIKFCVKCHDGNGATNTTARSNNGGTGTAAMPFGGIALGANYTAANGAIGTQGLVNVFKQFSSGNSSRHPIGAPNNRAYPYSTRLAAPYNNFGTTRDTNSQVSNSATPRTKADGVVLYCEDCHTTNTNVTLRTITAHGNAASLRGTYFAANPTLCLSCHVTGTSGAYNNTATALPGGTHGAGSAFSGGTGATTRPAAALSTCHYCHFSSNDTALVRPRKAQDIHGFNTIYNTNAGWTVASVTGMRPIAFMRNTISWPTGFAPRPYVSTATGPGKSATPAAGVASCGGTFAFGGVATACSSNGHTTYVPGGSY